jgi:predicted RNA-binding Zn-ribbon protein involved in translation (DUF1610 family)
MPEQEPSTTVSCSACGASVPVPGRIQDQKPCPACGSTARTFAVTLTDKTRMAGGRHEG